MTDHPDAMRSLGGSSPWHKWRNLKTNLTPRFQRKRQSSSRSSSNKNSNTREVKPPRSARRVLVPQSSDNINLSPVPNESPATLMTPKPSSVIPDPPYTTLAWQLTPPAPPPTLLMVTAKRHGSAIRKQHSSKRRRRCLLSDDQTSNDEEAQSEDIQQEWHSALQQLGPNLDANQKYWHICYGNSSSPHESQVGCWSATRQAPTKSCLSTCKKRPREEAPSTPSHALANLDLSSPSATDNDYCNTPKRVQFGASSAAEFLKEEPTQSAIKRLSQARAQELYSPKEDSLEEKVETQLTKDNTQILAQWQDLEDDDEDVERMLFDPNQKRRLSTLFSPTNIRLVDEEEDEEEAEDDNDDCLVAQADDGCISPLYGSPSRNEDEDSSSSLC